MPNFEVLNVTPLEKRRKNTNGYWQDPANIERKALELKELGCNLSQNSLRQLNSLSFTHAISNYHGGIYELRQKVKIPPVKAPRGYWNIQENIEMEAQNFLSTGRELTTSNLKKAKLFGLLAATSSYPGGIIALRDKLTTSIVRKNNGYWQDPENIEREARLIFNMKGDISLRIFREAGASSLASSIKYFPGGLKELKRQFGVSETMNDPKNWTPEFIEEEIRKCDSEGIKITRRALKNAGKGSLVHAIERYYPGAFTALKNKLNLDTSTKNTIADEQLRKLLEGRINE